MRRFYNHAIHPSVSPITIDLNTVAAVSGVMKLPGEYSYVIYLSGCPSITLSITSAHLMYNGVGVLRREFTDDDFDVFIKNHKRLLNELTGNQVQEVPQWD